MARRLTAQDLYSTDGLDDKELESAVQMLDSKPLQKLLGKMAQENLWNKVYLAQADVTSHEGWAEFMKSQGQILGIETAINQLLEERNNFHEARGTIVPEEVEEGAEY